MWQASECEKLCEKTKRQDLATWDLVCADGNIVLTASTSKNPPMNSQKLCCSHALLLGSPGSAPGCSKPAVSNARAGPKLRGPHLQVWGRGTLNHTCDCTSHVLRVISLSFWRTTWACSAEQGGHIQTTCEEGPLSPAVPQIMPRGGLRDRPLEPSHSSAGGWYFHSMNDQVPVPRTVS